VRQTPPEFMIDEEPLPLPASACPEELRDKIVGLIRRHADLAEDLRKIKRQTDRQQRKFFLSLLEVADAFDRIFQDTDLADLDEVSRNRLRSLKVTSNLLANVFDQEDIVPMEHLEGRPLDPHTQEVVDTQEQPDRESDIVLLIKERGYYWRDKVLRTAKVIVSKRV
jgi:molecular chaperone GrpE